MPEELKITSAKEYRSKKPQPFLLKVSDKLTVLMKPIEMTDAFFMNLIPMPAAGVKAKFEEMEKRLMGVQGDPVALTEVFNDTEFNLMDYLRRYACAAVIEPVIVMEDDGDEDHLVVTELNRLELMNIYNADSSNKERPTVPYNLVEEFRGSGSETGRDALPAGEDIRPETQLVDRGDREVISA